MKKKLSPIKIPPNSDNFRRNSSEIYLGDELWTIEII